MLLFESSIQTFWVLERPGLYCESLSQTNKQHRWYINKTNRYSCLPTKVYFPGWGLGNGCICICPFKLCSLLSHGIKENVEVMSSSNLPSEVICSALERGVNLEPSLPYLGGRFVHAVWVHSHPIVFLFWKLSSIDCSDLIVILGLNRSLKS